MTLSKETLYFLDDSSKRFQGLTSRLSISNTNASNKGSFQGSSAIQGCGQGKATKWMDKNSRGETNIPINALKKKKNLITVQKCSQFTSSLMFELLYVFLAYLRVA